MGKRSKYCEESIVAQINKLGCGNMSIMDVSKVIGCPYYVTARIIKKNDIKYKKSKRGRKAGVFAKYSAIHDGYGF